MTDDRKPRTDLSGYFQGISDRLKLQVQTMSPVIVHSGEMGDNDHAWFAEFVRQYLPKRIGVDTGFVVNSQSDNASKEFFSTVAGARHQDDSIGPQSDILLLDILDNAPFCVEKTFRVCPVEMVLGTIEVTRHLDASKLRSDLEKIARVRELAEDKCYSHTDSDFDETACRRPLGYIVGLSGALSLNAIINAVKPIEDNLRPNAIVILDQVLYIRKPYTTEFARIKNDVLFHFLSLLRAHVEAFPRGRTDLRSYLPAVADHCWQEEGVMGSLSADDEDLDEYFDQSGTSPPPQ